MSQKPAGPAPLTRRNLPLMMLQARERVIAHFRPVLNACGITEQQWRIIRLLLDTGPLEPHQIGELCRLSSPSLAGVLSRMQQMGLVRRKRLPDDQRRVHVSLTPRSRALAARMAPRIEEVYVHIERLMGREFSETFHRALDDLIDKLKADPVPGTARTPRMQRVLRAPRAREVA